MNIKNTWLHLRKVQTHRKWVRHYCFKLGIPWQGITHDLSKYSPVEFWESVKYYQGDNSPIDACKKANGYSMAWFHHRGRNKHHYEYWVDNFDKGMTTNLMPKKYFLELLADYLGAARAYMGDKFTYKGEYEWWQIKRTKVKMDPKQIEMLDHIFKELADMEDPKWREEHLTSVTADDWFGSKDFRKRVNDIYDYIKRRK